MHVQSIHIYPVKSIGGLSLDSAEALQRGFRNDRRLMLVDSEGRFITQRVDHTLALFSTELGGDRIEVRFRPAGADVLSLPVQPTGHSSRTVSIWDDTVQAVSVGPEADEWFSKRLGKPCQVVYMPETGHRPVDPRYADHQEHVSFADAYPYLLISQASLDDLNSRLATPVPMNRFRPNLVVSGCTPYQEDSWKKIRIGEVTFKVAKPCARCVLTTVDQESGLKGAEPLKTLASYRTTNNKVIFGQNLIALNEGLIARNDQVEVLEVIPRS
jgi:uncharacterized protein